MCPFGTHTFRIISWCIHALNFRTLQNSANVSSFRVALWLFLRHLYFYFQSSCNSRNMKQLQVMTNRVCFCCGIPLYYLKFLHWPVCVRRYTVLVNLPLHGFPILRPFTIHCIANATTQVNINVDWSSKLVVHTFGRSALVIDESIQHFSDFAATCLVLTKKGSAVGGLLLSFGEGA